MDNRFMQKLAVAASIQLMRKYTFVIFDLIGEDFNSSLNHFYFL